MVVSHQGGALEAAARLERRPSLPVEYEISPTVRAKWVGASETVIPGTMARRVEACRRFEGPIAVPYPGLVVANEGRPSSDSAQARSTGSSRQRTSGKRNSSQKSAQA